MEENDYLEQIALEEQRFQDLEEQARQDALLEEILAQQKTYQEESQTDQNSKKSNSKSSRPTDNQMQNRAKGRVSEQKHQRKATEKVFGQSMQQNAKTRMSDDSQREKATKYARQTREENQPKNSNQLEGENSMPINEKDGQDWRSVAPDDFIDQLSKEVNKSKTGDQITMTEGAMEKVVEGVRKLDPKLQDLVDKAVLVEQNTTTETVQKKEQFDPDKQNQGQENGNTSSSSLEENEVIKSENFLRNNMKDGTYINRDKVDDINQQFWNERESLRSKGFSDANALIKATEHKEEALKKLCKDAEKYSPKKLRQMQMVSGREGSKKEFYHCVKDKDGRAQLKQTTIGSKQTTYKQMRKQKKSQEKSHANKSSADMIKRGMPEKAMGLIGDAQAQSMTTFKISASLLLLIIKTINATRQNAKYNHIEKKIRDAIEIGEMDDDNCFDITEDDFQDGDGEKSQQNGLTMSSNETEDLEAIEPTNEEQEPVQEEKTGLTEELEKNNPKPEPEPKQTLTSKFMENDYNLNRNKLMDEANEEEEEKSINPDDIDQDGVNDEFEKKEAITDFDFDDDGPDGHDGPNRDEY